MLNAWVKFNRPDINAAGVDHFLNFNAILNV